MISCKQIYCWLCCFFFFFFLSCPSPSIPPRSRRWQEWNCWRHTRGNANDGPTQQFQHHRALPLCSTSHDGLFFKDKTKWCHLCAAHICSLSLWFKCSFHSAFKRKVLYAFVLCCAGFLSLCTDEMSNRARGATWSRWLIFFYHLAPTHDWTLAFLVFFQWKTSS